MGKTWLVGGGGGGRSSLSFLEIGPPGDYNPKLLTWISFYNDRPLNQDPVLGKIVYRLPVRKYGSTMLRSREG